MILLKGLESWPDISGVLLVVLLVVLLIVGLIVLCLLAVCVAAFCKILFVLITKGPKGVKQMSKEAGRQE